MKWDGNLYFCPTTSDHPITITQLSDTSTIPYHLPQLLPSHPTHHDKTSYHPNTIPSVSHLSHVHTDIIVEIFSPKYRIYSRLWCKTFRKRGWDGPLATFRRFGCRSILASSPFDLQNEVRALVEYKFSSFSGNVTFSAGSVGTGSSRDGHGAGGPQAGETSAEGAGGGYRGPPGRKQGPHLLCSGWTGSERT